MPLCSKIQVDLPETGIVIGRSGTRATVYKVIRPRREKGSGPERISIGKLDPATGRLIPNDNYFKHYGDPEPRLEVLGDNDSFPSVGWEFVFVRVFRELGLDGILEDCLRWTPWPSVMTAALHLFTRGYSFDRVSDFCEEYTLRGVKLTEESAARLYDAITPDDCMNFFKAWSKRNPSRWRLAYDAASFSTPGRGFDEDGFWVDEFVGPAPELNFGCCLSGGDQLPMFFFPCRRAVIDQSNLPSMAAFREALGIKRVCYVKEPDYCSTVNVRDMAGKGLDFMAGVDPAHRAAGQAMRIARAELSGSDWTTRRNRVDHGVFATAVPGRYFGIPSTMHVFHSLALRAFRTAFFDQSIENVDRDLSALETLTRMKADRLRKFHVIDRASDGSFAHLPDLDKRAAATADFGYVCVLTNTDLGSSEVLKACRRGSRMVDLFRRMVNFDELGRTGAPSLDLSDGKLFCAFIGLIVGGHLLSKLENLMRAHSIDLRWVMSELSVIHALSRGNESGYKLFSVLTGGQLAIMRALGLDRKDLEDYIKGAVKHSLY